MAVTATKKSKKDTNKKTVVSKKGKDYSNDPFFVKKAKAAEAFIKKNGLPEIFAK